MKHNQAVDFPKTGVAPPRLRQNWEGDLPPERVERWPDFMGKKQRLSYRSRNLLGHLYRLVLVLILIFLYSFILVLLTKLKPF